MEFLKELFKIISSKKITHTLLNFMILLVIILLFMSTSDLWYGFLSTIWLVSKPFIIGFAFAYVLNPMINYIEKYVIKRGIAVFMVYLAAFAILCILISLAIPLVSKSISELIPAFYSGLGEIGEFVWENFNYDISSLTQYIENFINDFFNGSAVLDTTIDVINQFLVNLTNFLIYIVLAIYMSSNFNNIRNYIKNIATKIDNRIPIYLREIDLSLNQYVKAFFIGAITQALTTMVMYLIIGHPNWIILSCISGVSCIIPYVGPIIANTLGLITSLGMGTSTIILLCVLIFIQSIVESYVITPKIYSAKIDLSIMWVLFGILSGSSLFGAIGMIVAMPVLVSLKVGIQVYKDRFHKKYLL